MKKHCLVCPTIRTVKFIRSHYKYVWRGAVGRHKWKQLSTQHFLKYHPRNRPISARHGPPRGRRGPVPGRCFKGERESSLTPSHPIPLTLGGISQLGSRLQTGTSSCVVGCCFDGGQRKTKTSHTHSVPSLHHCVDLSPPLLCVRVFECVFMCGCICAHHLRMSVCEREC